MGRHKKSLLALGVKKLAALSYRDICKKIKSGDELGGVYVLFGEEDYTKADAVSKFRKTASESGFEEFNLVRFSPSKINLDDLREAVETPPMLSELKLIEIDGGELFSAKVKDMEEYAKLLSFTGGTTAIVFHLNSKDKTEKEITSSPLYKLLAKERYAPTLVNCQKASPSEIHAWLSHRMSALNVTASQETTATLARKCSYSMFSLVSEVTKLASYANAKGRNEIFTEDIDKVVSENIEVGAFDLTNAISDRRIADALLIYSKMKRQNTPPQMILGSLVSNFSTLYKMKLAKDGGMPYTSAAKLFGINEYRAKLLYSSLARSDEKYLKKALALFTEADAKSKSLNTDGYAQVELLIASLG